MKPRLKLATATTPDGSEMVLARHDRDYRITVDGYELMNSRQHASEEEMARLGCAHLADRPSPRVLVGGLGMGYTLRRTLDLLGPDAEVVVAELIEAIVEWNRAYLGDLCDRPLEDPRVRLEIGDVLRLISASEGRFDTILLDVDNGPGATTDAGNSRIYEFEGIFACRRALRDGGALAVWSVEPSREFEATLTGCGFSVRRYRVPAYRGKNPPSRFVWVASEDEFSLPPGGGKPRRG
jgi:spermidine synthase